MAVTGKVPRNIYGTGKAFYLARSMDTFLNCSIFFEWKNEEKKGRKKKKRRKKNRGDEPPLKPVDKGVQDGRLHTAPKKNMIIWVSELNAAVSSGFIGERKNPIPNLLVR